MAIIYGRGYSATACRNLLARSDIRDMQLFVLHDADRDGYNIARTLGEATRRMPDHNVNVIDLGLTVPQAIAEGLETETWIRKVALPNTLQLDDEALEWFTGEEIEDKSGRFECTRCELNAFSATDWPSSSKRGWPPSGSPRRSCHPLTCWPRPRRTPAMPSCTTS
jgi:hypothetical protein